MAETADMDDENATSLKHGNEAFCELHAGQCVCGLKINKLIGRLYQSSLMHILHVKKKRHQRNQILFKYLRDKKKKKEGGSEKRGEISPFSPPLDPI